MCNLYSITKGQQAILQATRTMVDRTGNLPPLPGVFPDYAAPIVRNTPEGRELAMARWGMPTSSQVLFDATKKRAQKLEAKGKLFDFKALLRMEPDSGVTNIRNTGSAHWRPWLGPENRCVVPFTIFSEFNRDAGGDIWFAFGEERPLAFFAGIWARWTSVRKVREGEVTADLFGFLTTPPNREVGAIHPKAMPGHPDLGRGDRGLDDRPMVRGGGASTTPAGRCADDRGTRNEGGRDCGGVHKWCRAHLVAEGRASFVMIDGSARPPSSRPPPERRRGTCGARAGRASPGCCRARSRPRSRGWST